MPNSKSKTWVAATSLGVSLLATQPALAANDAMLELLKVLKDQGTITQQAYEQLANAAKADEEHNTADAAQIKQTAQTLPKIDTKGKLEWGTQDGDFTWRLGGRLHLDGTFYDNDSGTAEVSGVDARRARIELQGTLYKHWMWKLDYEFGQTNEVKEGFRDAYLRYLAKDHIPRFPTMVTVGQFKEHLGLEHQNSSNHMPFVERALVSRVFHDFAEASDGRRIGISVQTAGHDLWTAAFGVFGKNTSGDSADGIGDPISLQGRATISPIHTDGAALHFGFAGNWINLGDESQARFRARSEGRIGAQRFLDTGVIAGAEDVNRWGLEAGGIYGPLWVQAEYLRVDVHRQEQPIETVTFDGWHADVGWVLTGEPRGYDYLQGVFLNPKPNHNVGSGGWGAWELAARYGMLNFNDEDIDGGRETNFTIGVNWFLNPNFALKADWTKVLDIEGGAFDGETPNQYLLRAQAFW